MKTSIVVGSSPAALSTSTTVLSFALGGAAGLSAYQIWLSLGNSGTEQDFINSLASGGLPTDYTQAMDAANSPGGTNPFATISDTSTIDCGTFPII